MLKQIPLFALLMVVLLPASLKAQNVCTQVLTDAHEQYDAGNIAAVPGMLQACLKDGFNKAEKLQAYRLIILCHLFQDEPEKAEETFLLLLKLDPEYQVNPALDPAEFVNLYNSYRTIPLFAVGVSAGLNWSYPWLIHSFGVQDTEDQPGKYTSKMGYQFGANVNYYLSKKLNLSADVLFFGSKLHFENTGMLGYSNLDYTESQTSLCLPVTVKYNLSISKKLSYYFQAGAGTSFLLIAKSSIERKDQTTGSNQAIGPDVTVTDVRHRLNYSGILGAGIRYKVGYGYIFTDVKYLIGLRNVANPNKRYENPELLYNYGYVDGDFTANNLVFNFGYSKYLYQHKKRKQ